MSTFFHYIAIILAMYTIKQSDRMGAIFRCISKSFITSSISKDKNAGSLNLRTVLNV